MAETFEKKTRIPPNSKESEMMVLGCMLTSLNSLNIAADGLEPSDFYYTEHQIIYTALKGAYVADKPADIHLIAEELKRQGKLENVGGVSYLTTLAQFAGTSAFIEEYISLVREKAILRQMISAAQMIEKTALEEPADVLNALDQAQSSFFQISQENQHSPGASIKDLLSGLKAESKLPYLKELQERQQTYQEKGPNATTITGMPTHLLDLDKMLNGFNKSNLIILAARPSMGKCMVGETPVLDPETGALTPIKELVKRKAGKVVTLDKDWKLKETTPAAFVSDGIKSTYKVTTLLGKEIEATAPHPLLTIQGWKRVEELRVGDRIAIPRRLPYFGKKHIDVNELKVVAYLIADGNLTNSQPRFTNNNERIVADFKEAVQALGPVLIREEKNKNRTPTYCLALDRSPLQKLKKHFSQILQTLSKMQKRKAVEILHRFELCPTTIYGWAKQTALPSFEISLALKEELPELPNLSTIIRKNPITEILKKYQLHGKNSHQKFLPNEFFELPEEDLALFINRLFSCDGTAYVANCAGRPFPVIAYSSVSKRLIHQLQHLLLRFGIISKIRSKQTNCNGKKFHSFELEIHSKEDLISFCSKIGIYGKEKAVEAVFQQATKTSSMWTKDSLPIEIWDSILAKKGNRSWASLYHSKGLSAPSNLHAKKRAIRRETLAHIAYALNDLELAQIASSDIYWDRIKSITPTGEREVFDLTVEGSHNFVAADFIVHNTALAINIAENICFRNNVPVGIFSLEMDASQLLHRIICSQAEVESEKIQTGSLNGTEYQRIVSSANRMQKQVMIIDDQPGLKITDLRARARRMKESYNIGFLVIDYLQLIAGSGNFRSIENRQMEISEISRSVKNLARELNIPILCAAQLSRKVEERQGHRPLMSDLRESGSIENEADIVMMLFRRDYYDKYDKPGLAELIIAKNRHGPVGDVQLSFRKEIAQFASYSPIPSQSEVAKTNKEAFSAFSPEE